MDINTENVLANLKDFQKNTVEYVFKKLYGEGSTTDRFLIADEVGLGKTLIAKGIVAKAIDRLQEVGVKRIDIVYICSNGIIAQQNINRLNLTGQKDLAISSRLTLLPIYGNLAENEINFISLTPGTSFNLKSRGGMYIERVLLFHLINIAWQIEDESPALELLRVTQEFKNFKWHVKDFKPTRLSPDIVKEYSDKLNTHPKLRQTWNEMINRCIELGGQLDNKLRQDRLEFIGELRRILAKVCIEYLQPDIIIMDEFQKFRDILDQPEKDSTGIASFAHRLFKYEDKPANQRVKLILLSATPYKMYTTSYEKASATDNHYEDFFATIRFLQNDDESENLDLQQALSDFGDAFANFIRTDGKELDDIQQYKKRVEDLLLKVMVRTERLVAFKGEGERNGMLRTVPSTVTDIEVNDLAGYVAFQKIAHQIDHTDILEYWKSSPYLLNFMLKGNYRFKRLFDEKVAQLAEPDRQSLINSDAMLSFDTLKNYHELDPANSKLRYLIDDYIDKQKAWQLLWMPPSLPYYQLSGEYEGQEKLTKRLIFSAWRIVPRTLAMLMSYDVERRIHDRYTDTRRDYQNPPDGNLISFTIEKKDDTSSEGSRTSMTLMYPSLTLAHSCDPLKLPLGLTAEDAIEHTEAIIRPLIDKLRQHYDIDESGKDSRWYWLVPTLLDCIHYPEVTKQWFDKSNSATRWTHEETQAEGWHEYVNTLKGHVNDALHNRPIRLGALPNDLVSVLAKIALGSPAVCGLRAITRLTKSFDTVESLRSAVHIAWQMRLLYNRPFPTNLIRGQYRMDYWRAVLQYGIDGNLQAVLDEYTHVLRDSLGLFDANDNITAKEISIKVGHALSMGSISLNMEEYDKTTLTKADKPHGIRTHFAMSLLEDGSDNDDNKQNKKTGQSHQANLRDSFNSPFWPHVLISTSIGQEGLDFHQHCHAIVHWNLPHNPVDLEQREGRIHRYKGHAIRRNIARCYGVSARELFYNDKNGVFKDVWDKMFKSAEKKLKGQSDLMPFWIMPVNGDENYTYIERHVPLIPLSRDNQKFTKLRKMVGYYRMVFGQVRQEDMMDMLMDHSDALSGVSMKDLQIDLSPPEAHNK